MIRVAYTISGGVRSFVAVAPLLQERVLEPTAANGTALDLFFHLWLQPHDPVEAAGADAIRALPRVVATVFEDRSRRGELTQSFFNDSRLFNEAQAAEFHSGGRRGAFRSQWRIVYLALQLAFAHEAATARPYDAFVRARPDMLYSRPLDVGTLHAGFTAAATAGAYLATPLCITTNAANDVWMMGTRGAMAAYAAPPMPVEPACCEQFVARRLAKLGAFEARCPAAELPSMCAVSRQQEACACCHRSPLPTPSPPSRSARSTQSGGGRIGAATMTPLYRIAALGSLVPCPLAAQLAYRHRATCGHSGKSEAEVIDASMAPLRSLCSGGSAGSGGGSGVGGAAPKLVDRSPRTLPQLVLLMSCVAIREASPSHTVLHRRRSNNQTIERIIDAWVDASREQPRARCELLPCTSEAPPCQLPTRLARRSDGHGARRRPFLGIRAGTRGRR